MGIKIPITWYSLKSKGMMYILHNRCIHMVSEVIIYNNIKDDLSTFKLIETMTFIG